MREYQRLRIDIDPGPGLLVRLGEALETLDAKLTTIDLQKVGNGMLAAEIVVELPSEVQGRRSVAQALQVAGAGKLSVMQPVDEGFDPVLRAIRWACSMVNLEPGALDDEVTRVIGEICGTSDAWLLPVEEARAVEAGRESISRSEPIAIKYENVPSALPSSFCGSALVLCVPDSRINPGHVAFVVRPAEHGFSTSEARRIEAILAMRRRVITLLEPPFEPQVQSVRHHWADASTL